MSSYMKPICVKLWSFCNTFHIKNLLSTTLKTELTTFVVALSQINYSIERS